MIHECSTGIDCEGCVGGCDRNLETVAPDAIPILPGVCLQVYDVETDSFMPAMVVCRYGCISEYMLREHGVKASQYPDLVDVVFAHRPQRISHGHFTPIGRVYTNLNRGLV